MSYINPPPPELHGDEITRNYRSAEQYAQARYGADAGTVAAGGKPSTGTPADKRLKRNQPKAKPGRAMPYPTPKTTKRR